MKNSPETWPKLHVHYSETRVTFFVVFSTTKYLCDASRDLVSFVQFNKHEQHPWRSVTYSKVAGISRKTYEIHSD